MFGLDGHWNAYVGGWPSGSMRFSGFDRMADGETITVRLTKHGTYPFSITSEVLDPLPPSTDPEHSRG